MRRLIHVSGGSAEALAQQEEEPTFQFLDLPPGACHEYF